MAARKSAPKAEAPAPPQGAPAGGAIPEPERESSPAPDAVVAEPEPEPSPDPAPVPVEPIRRYAAPRPAPFRAGGHVLTERGWEIDTGQLDTDQKG